MTFVQCHFLTVSCVGLAFSSAWFSYKSLQVAHKFQFWNVLTFLIQRHFYKCLSAVLLCNLTDARLENNVVLWFTSWMSRFQEHAFVSGGLSPLFRAIIIGATLSVEECSVGLQSKHMIKAYFVAVASKKKYVCEQKCIYIYSANIWQPYTEWYSKYNLRNYVIMSSYDIILDSSV